MPLVSSTDAEVVDAVLAALHGLAEVPQDQHTGQQAHAAR